MTEFEVILSVFIGLIALVHSVWALGLWIPMRDEASLVRAVVGAKGATRMPGPIPCLLVAAGLVSVMVALASGPTIVRTGVLGLAGSVLCVRGGLAWVPFWRRITPTEPFATLDKYAYGPVCLVLGAGMIAAVWI